MPGRGPTESDLKRAVLEAEARAAEHAGLPTVGDMLRDHEERIRDMEKWQWKQVGVHGLIGIIVTGAIGVGTWWITEDLRLLRQQLPMTPAVISPRR